MGKDLEAGPLVPNAPAPAPASSVDPVATAVGQPATAARTKVYRAVSQPLFELVKVVRHPMSTIKNHTRRQQLISRVDHEDEELHGLAGHVVELVEGDYWQAVVLLLIVVDVCAVVLELLIDTETLVFDDEDTKSTTMHVLHAVSIGILVVFGVELFALLCSLGRNFFHHFWFTLDFVVVYGALLLESGLVVKAKSASSLIVLTRTWRVVRVVHGFIELEKHQHEKVTELKELKEEHEVLREEHEKKVEQHKHMSHRLSEVDKEWLDTHYPEEHIPKHGVTREPLATPPKTSFATDLELEPEPEPELGQCP